MPGSVVERKCNQTKFYSLFLFTARLYLSFPVVIRFME